MRVEINTFFIPLSFLWHYFIESRLEADLKIPQSKTIMASENQLINSTIIMIWQWKVGKNCHDFVTWRCKWLTCITYLGFDSPHLHYFVIRCTANSYSDFRFEVTTSKKNCVFLYYAGGYECQIALVPSVLLKYQKVCSYIQLVVVS